MKEYIRERDKQEKTSRAFGAALSLGITLCAILFCSFTGFRYLYPPPQENTFVIDFTEEIETVTQHRDGNQPQAEEIDLSRPIELVQRSESPYEAHTSQNLTPATAPDPHGDIEVPVPPEEPKLDPRAAFPGGHCPGPLTKSRKAASSW